MREIKFRAYNGKEMIYYHSLFGTGATDATNDVTFFADKQTTGGKSIETLMQFTGLTDKNGKEIYEGDIFQCISGDGKTIMQGETYFDDGSFKMKYGYQKPIKDQRKDYFLSGDIGVSGALLIEIIGNIYENPDLLPPTRLVSE